jgi:uncharacterized membrane protein
MTAEILALLVVFAGTYVAWKAPTVSKWAGFLGSAILAYLIGIVVGQIFPAAALLRAPKVAGELAVILCLPIFLFSADWKQLRSSSPLMLKALVLSLVSLIFSLVFARLLFVDSRPEDLAMLAGVYSGGTPNMAAIKVILDIPENDFILLSVFDTAFSALYLLGMLFAARSWKSTEKMNENEIQKTEFPPLKTVGTIVGTAWLLVLAVGAVSFLIPNSARTAFIIFGVSLGGLIISARKKGFSQTQTESVGTVFMLVFCVSLGFQLQPKALLSNVGIVFLMVGFVLFSSVVMHLVLCKLFRIPRVWFCITSIAAICSPPFVPVIAQSLNRNDLISPGISAGIIGYAIGTVLGISVFNIFSLG